jgi:hypothetical protein
LDKLLDIGFIYPIEITQWLFPLVIVPKKNGKLRICVDYHKLNAQTKKDSLSLPFLDSILDSIVGYEMYSFMDGYSSYNQVKMAEETKTKWHSFRNGAPMLTTLFFLGCVTPLLLSKK